MAYGLTSPANDLSLQDYAALCDVFYLGGTKCGALFGEAVVITNDDLKQMCIRDRHYTAALAMPEAIASATAQTTNKEMCIRDRSM